MQQAFGGLLQSDVTCSSCGYVSTALDPFLDISLDIDPLRKHPTLLSKRTPPPSSQKWVPLLRHSHEAATGSCQHME